MANEVIYIPAYVEEGVAKLQQAKTVLEQIESSINSGIATIDGSGYNRGIPHIEKGSDVSSAISSLKSTINVITDEISKYSNGEALDLENSIIIADPDTIEKYNLKKENINYTLSDYILNSGKIPTTGDSKIQGKWSSNYLTAAAGTNIYTGADGRTVKETWCDLNPNNLAKLMKEQHGIDLDYWIREDGVYMYGDYVMVAADIPHMDGTEQAAEYRKGDLVQTSLGTGIVVDLCGMAELSRKGQTGVDVWYDIYTAWHDGGRYQQAGYSEGTAQATMLKKSSNPTPITTQLRSQTVLDSNTNNKNTTTEANTLNMTTIETSTNTGNYSGYSGNNSGSNSASLGSYSNSGPAKIPVTTSSSQVSGSYNGSGSSKPAPNTSAGSTLTAPTPTQQNPPVVNTTVITQPTSPVVNTPIQTPSVNNQTNVESTWQENSSVNNPVITTPTNNQIYADPTSSRIKIPKSNSSVSISTEDTTIKEKRNNAIPIVAASAAGALTLGIGTKMYFDKKQDDKKDEKDEKSENDEEELS